MKTRLQRTLSLLLAVVLAAALLCVPSLAAEDPAPNEYGIRSYAAALGGTASYDAESYLGGTAFLIGNEGNGLTPEAQAAADCLIRIPMEGKVESLNAAMAAGLLMYEAARQRLNERK